MATFVSKIFGMQSNLPFRRVKNLLDRFNTKAVIFDLDGTLIDNNEFHLKTWRKYLDQAGIKISEESYNAHINGRTNKDAIEFIFGRKMSEAEAMKYTLEKEAIYRRLYEPFIKPVDGLVDFLETLNIQEIPMAIATSGIQPNIDYMFDHIPIKKYFKEVVNSAHIKKGKPDPEIYLKTASLLHMKPADCLVFEDSVVGVASGKAAGMKVIALSTTHPEQELREADLIINNYRFDTENKKIINEWT